MKQLTFHHDDTELLYFAFAIFASLSRQVQSPRAPEAYLQCNWDTKMLHLESSRRGVVVTELLRGAARASPRADLKGGTCCVEGGLAPPVGQACSAFGRKTEGSLARECASLLTSHFPGMCPT